LAPVPQLDRKIAYAYRNRVAFVVDDATFDLAKKTFPKELSLPV
jgi:hypothetical protein